MHLGIINGKKKNFMRKNNSTFSIKHFNEIKHGKNMVVQFRYKDHSDITTWSTCLEQFNDYAKEYFKY